MRVRAAGGRPSAGRLGDPRKPHDRLAQYDRLDAWIGRVLWFIAGVIVGLLLALWLVL